ncbi:MAG: sugar ABC transporter permease [Ruminococcaceae bacterium]|nr:sugar ABC transporter permease [Oscillospiraceae bacterium]
MASKFKLKSFMTMRRRHSLVGLSFVLPFIVGFCVFFLVPLIRSLMLSFGEITNYGNFTIKLTGFEHYVRAFAGDVQFLPMFLNITRDTFFNVPLITIFSFYIAMLLNRKMKGRGLFRVIFFLPVVLGSGFIMEQLLSQNIDTQSIEAAKEFLLPKEVIMYIGPDISNLLLFFLNRLTLILWRSGVQILIFLSGLQGISPTLYEAARVDSATEWENLWFITIPMMTPVILLNLIYTIVDSFTDASNPIIEYIMNYGFEWGEFEYAAAMGCIYLFMVIIFVALIFLIMSRFNPDSAKERKVRR